MSYLLDTNVISELRKGAARANSNVLGWSRSHPRYQQFLSAVTVFEIEVGVLRIERRDPVQGRELRGWLEGVVLPLFKGRILPLDADVAREAARLNVPDPRSKSDAFLAATALVHDLTVVTRNERDFAGLGVRIVNPWLAP